MVILVLAELGKCVGVKETIWLWYVLQVICNLTQMNLI